MKKTEKDKNIDKRILQTEAALNTALSQLLNQKNLSQITVGELTDSAGINRSTFYLHYKDVPAFCNHIEDKLAREVSAALPPPDASANSLWGEESFSAFLACLAMKKETYAPHLRSGSGGCLREKLAKVLEPSCREFARNCKQDAEETVIHAYGTLLLWGSIAVAEEWLRNGARVPVATMADILNEFSGNDLILKKFRENG